MTGATAPTLYATLPSLEEGRKGESSVQRLLRSTKEPQERKVLQITLREVQAVSQVGPDGQIHPSHTAFFYQLFFTMDLLNW